MTLTAAADGSALGNPGPAGWAWYMDAGHWACGGWPHGTNNMGELTAVLDLLQQTASSDEDLLIICDSMYVINSITKWMPGWKRKGWRKGDGKPVQNVDIMKALDAAMQGRQVSFKWVRGHTGHKLNEAADRLANGAAAAFSKGARPDPGPGFGSRGQAPGVPSPEDGKPDGGSGSEAPGSRSGSEEPGSRSGSEEPGSRPGSEEPGSRSGSEEPGSRPGSEAPDDVLPSHGADQPTHHEPTHHEPTDHEPTDREPTDEERVVGLERSLLRHRVEADRSAVAALLHQDWCEISRSGRLNRRAEMLDHIVPMRSPVSFDLVSVSRLDDHTILLVWRALAQGRSSLRSSIWVRDEDDWRQRFHHGTDER